jgi:cytochrome c-type biogenesis protein
VSLLATYALGLGIPFLLAALAVKPFMRFMQKFRRHLHKVEIVAGALLVITGILIFTNSLGQLSYYMLEVFPWLAKFG